MYFIGIDIGTSSICGVAYNYLTKETETITRQNDASIKSIHPWERIQDTNRIMHLGSEIMEEFATKYSDIKGIGVTGQMHGILYLNSDGNAVSPLYTWQDNRANQPYKDNKTYVEYLHEKTNHPLATGFGLVTHFYNKENGLVPAGAAKLCTIMDYVVMKLSGRKSPLIDHSNGASLGFFDKKNLRFDTQSLENVGIDLSLLPELGESTKFAGYYNDTIPVYSAIGDNQASFLGSVQNIHSSIQITVGTSSQISVYSEKYVEIETLDTRPFPGGGYILVGAALCGGQSFSLLKTFFENTLNLFNGKLDEEVDIYKIMTSIQSDVENKNLPIVETLFDGTRSEPGKRGNITNISTTNLTPENLICGFLKGICRELYDFYELIPENIKKDKVLLVGSGNGIKKNPLLCRAFEEQFNYKLQLSSVEEESAFGACICAIPENLI